jgi:hypothetical protein
MPGVGEVAGPELKTTLWPSGIQGEYQSFAGPNVSRVEVPFVKSNTQIS